MQRGTPRAPISAHLPLLPSGPGGFSEMTPRGESWIRLRAGHCADANRLWVISPTEDSPSGLWRSLGKRVGSNPSGVQIPYPPPVEALAPCEGFAICPRCLIPASAVLVISAAVACPSGQRSAPRKRVWGQPHRGFKSHRHRHTFSRGSFSRIFLADLSRSLRGWTL